MPLIAHTLDRRRLGLAERTAFASVSEALVERIKAAARFAGDEVVILSTCERFEVYRYDSAGPVTVAAIGSLARRAPGVRVRRGRCAVRHLLRVAAGLESRLPGEPHVLGQVRSAAEEAARQALSRRTMNDLFAHAVRCGRAVRRRTALGCVGATYATCAAQRIADDLGDLGAVSIGVIGSGAMAVELARMLDERGAGSVTLIGRHEARTRAAAEAAGAVPMRLAELAAPMARSARGARRPVRFDALVTAVSTAAPVLGPDAVQSCGATLIIDVGAAPNVDRRVGALPGVTVGRLDDLAGDRRPLQEAVRHAEPIVQEHGASLGQRAAEPPRRASA
jgi:glutamyl-tRNA reductase